MALESWQITPTCRFNRGNDGAWDEAVEHLRKVYDAQLYRFGPTATITLSIDRERAEGVIQDAYNACFSVSLRSFVDEPVAAPLPETPQKAGNE